MLFLFHQPPFISPTFSCVSPCPPMGYQFYLSRTVDILLVPTLFPFPHFMRSLLRSSIADTVVIVPLFSSQVPQNLSPPYPNRLFESSTLLILTFSLFQRTPRHVPLESHFLLIPCSNWFSDVFNTTCLFRIDFFLGLSPEHYTFPTILFCLRLAFSPTTLCDENSKFSVRGLRSPKWLAVVPHPTSP